MYLYKIGYYSYEETDYAELKHEQSFSKSQITEMVAEAIIDILTRRTKDDYYHSYQDFHERVIKWLVEHKGFVEVEYDTVWSEFGWGSVFCGKDWDRDRDTELNRLAALLNEAGYDIKDDSFLGEENG